jgi:hypothetical protein
MESLEKSLSEGSTQELLKLLNSKTDLPASSFIAIIRKYLNNPAVQSCLKHPRIIPFLKYYLFREEDGLYEWYLMQFKNKNDLLKAVRNGNRAEITRAIKTCKNQQDIELYFAGLDRQRLQSSKVTLQIPTLVNTSLNEKAQNPISKDEVDERQIKKQKLSDFSLDSLILEK